MFCTIKVLEDKCEVTGWTHSIFLWKSIFPHRALTVEQYSAYNSNLYVSCGEELYKRKWYIGWKNNINATAVLEEKTGKQSWEKS